MDARSLKFARYLCGQFSNKKQAAKNPASFAHINIYFRPLPWEILEGPGFYSEQSYDHDPWRPYRQGIHRLVPSQDIQVVENFEYNEPMRVAGAGFKPELLKAIKKEKIKQRCGCSMIFKEDMMGCFTGELEPGKKCIVPRDGRSTYLVSEVYLSHDQWISRDRGFDQTTDGVAWGSEHGPLEFERVASFGVSLTSSWLLGKNRA